MESEAVITALEKVISNVTDVAGEAAPLVLGVIGTLTGINIAIKLFKRFANKAA